MIFKFGNLRHLHGLWTEFVCVEREDGLGLKLWEKNSEAGKEAEIDTTGYCLRKKWDNKFMLKGENASRR